MAYVTAILTGGFANRIFIIHTALHYAERTGRKFVIVDKYINTNAHESKEITMESLEKLFFPFTYYRGEDFYSWKFIRDPDQNAYQYEKPLKFLGQSIVFDGYFQSPKYFLPQPISRPTVHKKPHTYFLHIRLGDYLTSDYYDIPLKKYYSEAIIQIIENDIDANFLVFSNENTKAQEFINTEIKVPFDYRFSEAESAYDTLLEMSSCSGAICANSSLSWMGAYYQSEPRTNIYMPYPWVNSEKKIDVYPEWAQIVDLQSST